ncbi:MAG: cysteine desulfurase family protein [Alphaproteobacteria bacterium]
MSIYLDYNATAPLRHQAAQAILDTLDIVGNPSSVHALGRAVRQKIDLSRQIIADYFACLPQQIVFNSGATEANNAVLKGFKGPVIVSAVEHDSVRLARADAIICPATTQGVIDLDTLDQILRTQNEPCLVSLMWANNETGVIQPLAEAAAIARSHGALIHCDMVQAVGKVALSWNALNVDYATFSGHKIGAPTGAGVIIFNPQAPLFPLQSGGGQEKYFRPGTENVLGIIGLGAAISACNDDWQRISDMRDNMEKSLVAFCPEITVFGLGAKRLPNTSNLTMPGVKSDTQVMHFDLQGIAVSAGTACSSGKVKISSVLLAMGVPEKQAETAIRVSLGPTTTNHEIEVFIAAWQDLYNRSLQGSAHDRT